MNNFDELMMKSAMSLAETAAACGEVPIGAVITKNDQIIASGFNQKEIHQQVSHHAEIIAITQACKNRNSWRLEGCTLYVTLEPCLMCAGAIYQARFSRVIFATPDPKGGALGSLYEIQNDSRLNHQFTVERGLFQKESSTVLKEFFKKRRQHQLKDHTP